MNQFNLEEQYGLYLKLNSLSEATMHPIQKRQIKQTFYGAIGMFIILMEKHVADLDEDHAMIVMDDFEKQINDFFEMEIKKEDP